MTSTVTTSTDQVAPATATRVLQRVVFPTDRDLDVIPLYVEAPDARAGATASASTGTASPSTADAAETRTATGKVKGGSRPGPGSEYILDRNRVRVAAEQRASFATYFNAFPASYWRRWSIIDTVTLNVRVSGEASVVVYRSTADGRAQRISSVTTDDQPDGDFSFELPLKPFGDGGWYWFDVFAGSDEAVLEEATWCAEVPLDRAEPGRVTIGITTFNRPDSCVELLAQLADDKEVTAILDELIVVDQGDKKVADEADFGAVSDRLGSLLRVIDQGNLGGSGGFARAQYEVSKGGRSDYVLLLDDDIVAETESVLRATAFADLAVNPTIVGGHMFSLYKRSVLHSFGERVDLYRFWWGAAPHVWPEHDFVHGPLRTTGWLHRRVDVDFNGWWMCLIPRQVVDDIGLGLPLFIKWDDAEYSLRAGAAGYPTVSMPGVAVWHVPWTDKNDALDWQAYYHQRNRMVAALLHSPFGHGGSIIRESLNHQVKHLVSMQYSVAELRLLAIEAILDGPDHLHEEIGTRLGDIRALRKEFPDSSTQANPYAFPPPRRRKPPRRGFEAHAPHARWRRAAAAGITTIKQMLPATPESKQNPQAVVAAADARWFTLAMYDSAIVSTNDGTAASWYRRDPERFRTLLSRTFAVHQRLYREWPRLSVQYQRAAQHLTSHEAWEETFAAAAPPKDEPGAPT